ncbi:MAG: ATP-binding protein [Planctomycetota bacterium]|jgi:transitional endoplasmic reticulum ATPase
MRRYYDLYRKYLDDARAAEDEGRNRPASRCYLKAASYLLLAAKTATGRLKETRRKQAKTLVEYAERLKSRKADRASRGSPPKERMTVGADEDGLSVFEPEPRTGTTFEQIAGLEDVKREIKLKMVEVVKNPELAGKYGLSPGGGFLLHGPPGTGKTMLAKAMAEEIDAAFFSIKPSEIMSKWVGDAEKNIQQLFQDARRHQLSIIFIDEIEALVPKRSGQQSTVMKRLVPQILQELEGFDSAKGNPILFVGATNVPWVLDEAILRPGRFNIKFYIGPPDEAARRKILELNLKDRPLGDDIDLDRLAAMLDGFSGADIRNICDQAASGAFMTAVSEKRTEPIEQADLVAVIEKNKPSITADILKKFDKWINKHG